MTLVRSIALFLLAALAEIGGAWLIWQGIREHRGLLWVGAGVVALGAYGFVATFQPDPNFGRILATYGGIFVAGSLAWGMVVDGSRPDRYDYLGALICRDGRCCRGGPRGRRSHGLRVHARAASPPPAATRRPPATRSPR
ncbi:YnfA family protein [Georgenia yuyongxinii]|uniref:YnfA family protein n=1 Tax=Georgenia yuyongxinii TaxID=2589797 RepID=A0A5B8CA16_9MICO|nr:YnfA family protein [Georgenia yuyongxinii]